MFLTSPCEGWAFQDEEGLSSGGQSCCRGYLVVGKGFPKLFADSEVLLSQEN